MPKTVNPFKNGAFSEFVAGSRALQITKPEEWLHFVSLCRQHKLGLSLINKINSEGGYLYLNHLAHLNRQPEDIFLFEHEDGKGMTWDHDVKRSTEWFGQKPLVFKS